MYEYRPTRTNANAKITVVFCFFVAVVAFAGASFVPKYPSVLQCVGLCMLLPVVQITARYLVLQYLYRLHPRDDGGVDFEVFTYRGGARMQLVCRIGLEEITAATPLTEANRKAPQGLRRYNYHPDMKPREGMVLSVTNGDGDCEVFLSPDPHLREVFLQAAEK